MSNDVKNIYNGRQIKEQETEITGTCCSTVISFDKEGPFQ